MARNKIVSRKAKREEVEAAEKAGLVEEPAPKKKAGSRSARVRVQAVVRKKLFWGVFNQSLKRVATFEYYQKKEAAAKAESLSQSGKSPHFVQKVKENIEE
ncbi:MAG: hypothetical protein FJ276_12170 [Planctomycetes bacterium]|nr:hypothetical protein [Planctomycetota bacterium]